jgi:FeS assembly SUF system protein
MKLKEKEEDLQKEELTKDSIIEVLKKIFDPEIPVDIYSLGLIYNIDILPNNNVYILMTLTSPNCPAAEIIPCEVEKNIKNINMVNDVYVELTFDPPYTSDMMSDDAKLTLGFL